MPLVPVSVVDIWVVFMGMPQGQMRVRMHMRLGTIPVEVVLVLMMGVVRVFVRMI